MSALVSPGMFSIQYGSLDYNGTLTFKPMSEVVAPKNIPSDVRILRFVQDNDKTDFAVHTGVREPVIYERANPVGVPDHVLEGMKDAGAFAAIAYHGQSLDERFVYFLKNQDKVIKPSGDNWEVIYPVPAQNPKF